jgi:hypothetical protein
VTQAEKESIIGGGKQKLVEKLFLLHFAEVRVWGKSLVEATLW